MCKDYATWHRHKKILQKSRKMENGFVASALVANQKPPCTVQRWATMWHLHYLKAG